MKYDHLIIEPKWQKRWLGEHVFSVTTPAATPPIGRRGAYVLDMFPYPSGDGLHVGHPEGYTATDIYCRYLRMKGVDVLHPMGWDAFGLPAENYAIKQGVHPAEVTSKNVANFKRQIQSLGFSYDWTREVNTTDPKYYKWTQWIFLQLFKRGLAYEKESPIWWCPKDKTGLANEEVVDGKCDRCGTVVGKKMLRQWMLKITAYAERLISGLDNLDWPVGIKTLQRNWIGKSEGAEVVFEIPVQGRNDKNHKVVVFTTRPDTLFGATYLVLSPEHELVVKITTPKQKKAVEKYVKSVAAKSDLERTALEKEKTGVFTGAFAVNPVNNEKIPVWIADYVLSGYGTGAIMAVPAHDERDWEFAQKYKLPIIDVVIPSLIDYQNPPRPGKKTVARRNVHAFVRNKHGDVLALKWPKYSWNTMPMGGVEDGEDIIEAARREVREETGYKNLKFEQILGGPIRGEYFVPHKDINRVAITQLVVFTLENDERDPISAEESAEHQVIWLSLDQVNSKNLRHVELDTWLERMGRDNQADIGEGVMINSGQFDGLTSTEGRKKIVEWLGEGVTASKKANCIIIHGCPDPAKPRTPQDRTYDKHWMPWLKAALETSGMSVEVPLMPTPWEPKYEEWKKQFEKLQITESTILIGHSCGSTFLVRWLGETKRKVRALMLVAPWKDDRHADVQKRAFYTYNIDPTISDRVPTVAVYTSDNEDPEGKVFAKLFYKKLGGELIELQKRGHFTLRDMGTPEFPELLKKITALTLSEPPAKFAVNYKLRDWVFSRQRYWGEPIPLVHCEKCGVVPVPEDQLPVLLPDIKRYEPTGTGESPLAVITDWVNTTCPKCGGAAKRETNTMPQWAGSCWYYLRYLDPENDKALASPEAMKAWLPVDMYVGGAEHAVLHLLYARFWHKVLFDAGVIPKECGDEPFLNLKNQGLILGPDGEKMSKSRGNVINPDEIVEKYGADTLRMYEMFMGPFEDAKPWDTNGIIGIRRFLDKVWRASERLTDKSTDDRHHRYIKSVGEGIDNFRFNTCVSDLMKWLNEWGNEEVSKEEFAIFLKILNPFAPHITEELWSMLGNKKMLVQEKWPAYDESKVVDATVTIAVQVMGKLRATITMPTGSAQISCEEKAKSEPNVAKYLTSQPKKVIFVKDKLINFVV